jgi:hypothetical protein
MITKFDNYSQINEYSASKWATLALYLTIMFNPLKDVNQATKKDEISFEFLVKYFEMMDSATKNPMIQEVVRDFKHKVINDPKIINKQEVLKVIDNTPIVFRKDDKICNTLYQHAKEKYKTPKPSSWCTTLSDTTPNAKPISVIFLSKDADYYEVIHELSHAVEKVVKVDPKIIEPFNFNMPFKRMNAQFMLITAMEYSLKNPMQREYLNYLSDPSEIYSRMNSFKMFLYRNKIINTPNDDVTELIIAELMTGKIYNNLDEKRKKEFVNSDFMDIIVFLDLNKRNSDLNKYVDNFIKQNKSVNHG